MFKNKTLQLNLVNKPKSTETDVNSEAAPSVDYAQIVRETTETVAKNLIIGVATYVAVDTLRQVIVKITPAH
jgi:hypothetical protein